MNWIKKNKLEFLIIAAIILISLFLRFYKIDEYMTFLGDEGRDALVVKKILTEFDFPLLGPPMSVGNIYLGPLYYYMMTVAMGIFWLNPVAASWMVALIGTLTVSMIYYLSREWFGVKAAIVSSLLYTLSPVAIIYAKSSWNPNPIPFFTLLTILGLYLSRIYKNYLFLIITGVSAAFLVQMHWINLIMFPVLLILWLYELRFNKRPELNQRKFYSGSLIALLSFLFLMSPLLIYDLKYDFQNSNALKSFFLGSGTEGSFNLLNSIGRVFDVYFIKFISRFVAYNNIWLGLITSIVILTPLLVNLFRTRQIEWKYLVLLIWLSFGLLGLSVYSGPVYDHYLNFLSPVPFFLIGALFALKTSFSSRILFVGVALLTISIAINNILFSPLKTPPNKQLQRTQEVAKFVLEKTDKMPYNFALLAKNNYDSAYQYYLDQHGHPPKKVPFQKTEQLIVVCEDIPCVPNNNPKYEIAAFGMSKVVEEDEIWGLKLYRLVPNPSGNP